MKNMFRYITFRYVLTALCLAVLLAFATACGASEEGTDETADNAGAPPVIGISYISDEDDNEELQLYANAVKAAGGEVEYFKCFEDSGQVDEALASVDAVLLAGGEDVSPSLYGAEPIPQLEGVSEQRDASDLMLVEACVEQKKPLLCICRGMHILNVYCGGTLYQDLPAQFGTEVSHRSENLDTFVTHNVKIEEGTALAEICGAGDVEVYSWHHQGIDKLGDGLTASAKSDDGLIEAVEYGDSPFLIGVQPHLEWEYEEGFNEDALCVFKALVDAAE